MAKLTGAAKEEFLARMQGARKKRGSKKQLSLPERHPDVSEAPHGEREITAKELFFGARLRRRR
jgi:hypothetical protein